MNDREFWSSDRRFGLRIPAKEVERMVRLCKKAKGNETGGVIAGSYSDDQRCANVTSISEAPPDSKAGGTWFSRGVQGVQRWLDGFWRTKAYYVGEWHFHPFAAPDPSGTDISEMQDIAVTDSFKCPEPVLIILGGDPNGAWRLRAFVFPRGRNYLELAEVQQKTEPSAN